VELLGAGHEHEGLDYKRELDLNDRDALLELVKDVAAFSAAGGYLVVGCDGGGQPSGLVTAEHADPLDESRLRAKVKRYLPEPLALRTATHELDGARLVLIHVGVHPDGFVIVKADGASSTGSQVFRRGDVFVRHGTASERWEPHDFAQIKEAMITRHIGIPELVPGPPSTHRIDPPRLVRTGEGEQMYQRLLVEIENVGAVVAHIGQTSAEGYEPGVFRPRPPVAIPAGASRPLELHALVADDDGLDEAEFTLRMRYTGGGRAWDLLTRVHFSKSHGFENRRIDIFPG
jgi:hypothetical protein